MKQDCSGQHFKFVKRKYQNIMLHACVVLGVSTVALTLNVNMSIRTGNVIYNNVFKSILSGQNSDLCKHEDDNTKPSFFTSFASATCNFLILTVYYEHVQTFKAENYEHLSSVSHREQILPLVIFSFMFCKTTDFPLRIHEKPNSLIFFFFKSVFLSLGLEPILASKEK